jgi:hypothetical protein
MPLSHLGQSFDLQEMLKMKISKPMRYMNKFVFNILGVQNPPEHLGQSSDLQEILKMINK